MGLTKEEKKAVKEAKRLQKLAEEAALAKKLKKDEMQREMAIQAMKKGELDKTWRQTMLRIKEPVFKKDVEVMLNTFERACDKKENLIKHIIKLIDVADSQYQRTIASFCVTVNTMINKFLDDLNAMDKENNINTKNILINGEKDAATIKKDHNAAETHLQLLLYDAHTTADTLAWTTRGENLVKADEDNDKFSLERDDLRSFLEDIYNCVWDEYKTVLRSYIVSTAENQKQVRRLRFKENLMADIIAAQAKKIANSDGLLKRLRTDLASYESGTKQAAFRERRNRHRAACYKLKKRMMKGCRTDVNKLALLVRESDVAMRWLESSAKKGEKILRLAALCRKFESQREKILPYGSKTPYSPVHLRQTKSDDSLIMNAMSSSCGLTRLWQRISKAELTRRALHREKILLEQENLYIAQKIKERQETNIGPESLQCTCSDSGKKTAIHPPVSIEGVLEINKYKYM